MNKTRISPPTIKGYLSKIINILFILITYTIISLVLNSCILKSSTYDDSSDDGTYSGNISYYDSPYNAKSICSDLAISITKNKSNITFSATDISGNNVFQPVSNSSTVKLSEKNLFKAFLFQTTLTGSNIENPLSSFNICDQTLLGIGAGTNTSDIRVSTADEFGHHAEIGSGIARGNLFFEIRCNDGRTLPMCLYYFELNKI